MIKESIYRLKCSWKRLSFCKKYVNLMVVNWKKLNWMKTWTLNSLWIIRILYLYEYHSCFLIWEKDGELNIPWKLLWSRAKQQAYSDISRVFLKIDVHYFLQIIRMSVATSFYVGHKPMYLEPRPLSLVVTITSIFRIFRFMNFNVSLRWICKKCY